MGEATAIEGEAEIDQPKMNWIADHVVDDDRRAAHAQALVYKLDQVLRLQMMNKQTTADHIKTSVREGKSNGIAGYSGCSMSGAVSEMRMSSIEKCDLKLNP